MNSFTNISREARRKGQLQVNSLVDGSIPGSVGTRRVQEILGRCHHLASKKGQDIYALRKSLKDDEEKAVSEKIARRLSAYFASLGTESSCHGRHHDQSSCSHRRRSIGTELCPGSSSSRPGPQPCSCYRIADWPVLNPDNMMLIDHDSDSDDDLADELYSTVYLGGTSDWVNNNKSEFNSPQNSPVINNNNNNHHRHHHSTTARRTIPTNYSQRL